MQSEMKFKLDLSKKDKFPHRPPLQKSLTLTLPKWVILTMGVYGEIPCLLSDLTEISFLTT